jgi:4-amino-4-deoxy-L-arabinose transferase-like glycosyltransferase
MSHIVTSIFYLTKPLPVLLLILLSWAAIYLPGLGKRELQGEEARRILPGRTMLQTGDWLVPRSAGEVYNRKPPGINWATAIAIVFSGRMDEQTVRLPSALAILALACFAALMLRPFLGQEGAFLSAFILLTNIGFIEKGRLAEIEGLYCALFGMAAISWLVFWWQKQSLAAWVVSGLFLGLAFLMKGPPHVWFFYAMVIGVLRQEKRLSELLNWRHLLGLIVFTVTWSWWAYFSAEGNPQHDSSSVWIEQIASRLGLSDFHLASWLLLIPKSLSSFLPWVILIPLAIHLLRDYTSSGDDNEDRRTRILVGLGQGLLVGFLVIALLPSSRPRFLAPLGTVAALFLVGGLRLVTKEGLQRIQGRWTRGMTVLSILGVVGIAISPVFAMLRNNPAAAMSIVTHSTVGLGVGVAAVFLLGWKSEWLRSQLGSMRLMGVSVAIPAALAIWVYALQLEAGIVPARLKPFAEEIQKITGKESPIILFRIPERMWPFYLGLWCREIADPKDLPDQATWVLTPADKRDKNLANLERKYGAPIHEQRLREPLTDDAGGKGIELILWQFR